MSYFDRQGNPISLKKFAMLFEDVDYRLIRQTNIGDVFVSTVWMGIDHGFGYSDWPIIFETMVFGIGHGDEEQYRYATEEEAISHHEKLVEELTILKGIVG